MGLAVSGEIELYKKYRPQELDDVYGQDAAVKSLKEMVKRGEFPHTILFTGGSGCGKTTLARILRKKLNCADNDYIELDAAQFRGIDTVRDIRGRMQLAPIGGTCRVYLLDEVHQLTGAAADGLLKMLEDTPPHVYFFLCTTNPEKLKKTIKTRCTHVVVKPLTKVTSGKLLDNVLKKEKKTLSNEVRDKIIEVADGSARKLLVLLHSVIGLDDEDDQLECVGNSEVEVEAINLCRVLFNPRAKFPDVANVLRDLKQDPEEVRWRVLAFARSALLKGGRSVGRAYAVLVAFRDNFYDSKHAGLAAACFEVMEDR